METQRHSPYAAATSVCMTPLSGTADGPGMTKARSHLARKSGLFPRVVLLCALVPMRFASSVRRLMGHAGASPASRIIDLLCAAVAAEHIMEGLVIYFKTPGVTG